MSEPEPKKGIALVIDDELNMCRILEKTLRLEGFDVAPYTDPKAAMGALKEIRPDVVLTDLLMPGMDGMAVVASVKRHDPSIPAIIVTAHGSIHNAVNAMKAGAFDYVTKPFLAEELLLAIEHALEFRRLHEERASVNDLWNRTLGQEEPVGESEGWRSVMNVVEKVAATPSAVLILGETGVGKELVARAIHRRSLRAAARFVPINCASIHESLLESELFGHEKGAFTGAVSRKLGLFELASHGTLFLDEIGDMPLALQPKILRALQERAITRVGGTHEVSIDTRLITATHRDIEKARKSGEFREDLYYRLNVIKIVIPPLRDRPADIAPLARHFVAAICGESGRPVSRLSDEAIQVLQSYHWPGNARELRNVLERTLVLFDGDSIGPEDLRADLPASPAAGGQEQDAFRSRLARMTYQSARDEFEREYVASLLKRCNGNVSAAAREGQMSRRNLYEKIEKLRLPLAQAKDAGEELP